MAKTKTINLRLVAAGLLILAAAASIGYKYFEWKSLRNLASLYEASLVREFDNINSNYKLTHEFFYSEESKEKDEIFKNKDASKDELLVRFSEIDGDCRVLKDNMEKALSVLKENKKDFEKFQVRANFLFGKRKNFVKDFITAQLKFYDNEIKDVEDGLIYLSVISNDLNAYKDSTILGFYAKDTGSFLNENAVKDKFRDIASLEKYTRDDFKFDNEDRIKEDYSYAYESLKKQQNYFKSTYLAIKDLVAGDKESAYYKFSRIGAEIADLGTIDRERMEKENQDKNIEIKKNLAQALLKRIQLLKEFEQNGLGTYSGLQTIDDWSMDLSACYLYLYKTDLYKKMKDEYPKKVSSLEDLQKELNQITPDTSDVDNSIPEGTVKVENKDNKLLIFTCKDESRDKTYELKDHYKDDKKEEETIN
jgi:hypothetical protein